MHPSYPLSNGLEEDVVNGRKYYCYLKNQPSTVKFAKRSLNKRVRNKQKQLIKEEMKYIKKPVVIDAVQFDGNIRCLDVFSIHEVKDFILGEENGSPYIIIPTLEGAMRCSKGDYLIRGIKGEFYPCKPDIFHLTYEAIENTKKTFNLELTKEELLNSKGEVFMTNYLGLVIEGEEIRPQTLNYRIRLTDREFPIILKGSKFVSITECREGERFYTPSTNPEILKFLTND